jgi:hypothetical protein
MKLLRNDTFVYYVIITSKMFENLVPKSRKRNSVSQTKHNRLMLFTKVTDKYSQNSVEHTNALREISASSVKLKQTVHIDITVL